MRNGKELPPGKVLLIDNDVLVYKSEYGDLSVPISQVEQIVFVAGTKDREGIVLSTGDWIGGSVTSYRDGAWQIKTDFGQAIVTKPESVTSVNFARPKVVALKGGLATKGVTYRYVVDWLYTNELTAGANQDEWALRVEKISLANNQIAVSCSVKPKTKIINLYPIFKLRDEFGAEYGPVKNTFGPAEYSFLEWKSGQVVFPALRQGSRIMELIFGNNINDGYGRWSWQYSVSTPKLEIADLMAF
ncbi:MAG TPA: hypothetical protein VIO60_01235 [Rectinemataceae bacterium]